MRQSGPTHPTDYTNFAGAFAHFMATWYEKPDDPMDTLEIRHAFFSGAIYLRSLVSRAQKLGDPQLVQEAIVSLFKELKDEAARNAAAPWTEKLKDREQAAPSPMHSHVITGPGSPPPLDNVGVRETGETAQQPMMWTIGMVQEFDAGYRGAMAAGAPTFPFKGRTFRTADAPAILSHLRDVFQKDKPQPPQQ